VLATRGGRPTGRLTRSRDPLLARTWELSTPAVCRSLQITPHRDAGAAGERPHHHGEGW
jgi:hypothetical protein